MSFAQALVYFAREALVSLARSWKVGALAVVTIAVSLFVGGAFWMVSSNLARLMADWQQQAQVVVYLRADAPAAALAEIAAQVAAAPWATEVETVTRDQAQQRFGRLFPALAELVGDEVEALPAAVEVSFDPAAGAEAAFDRWIAELERHPQVESVDDDRAWLGQLAAVLAVARALGLGLALVLLAAAVFTTASVVRLTAYLYRDEIAIMRLVGATEFFIRGPFYTEGLFQGLAGGLLAAGALFAAHRALAARTASAWAELATGSFLSPVELASLVAVGGAAGLFGAVASLRRESLGADG